MKPNRKIDVSFSLIEEYDSRFQKVEIWLMHLEENYNGSYFSKEVVEKALPTLGNTPILGYVEESKLGKKDFRGHEMELIVEDNDVKVKYLGNAYGVIPESCNPRFKKKVGSDGREREYLVVDGIMWTKLDDAISILEDKGFSGQSMELDEEGLEGYYEDDGFFHFTNFKFYGACLLGEDVLPAMDSSTVELQFSNSKMNETINSKLKEFYQMFSKKQEEVDVQVDLEKLLEKYNISKETLEKKVENYSELSIEELDQELQKLFRTDEDNEEDKSDKTDLKEATETKDTEDDVKDNEDLEEEDSKDPETEEAEESEETVEEHPDTEGEEGADTEDFSKKGTKSVFDMSHEKIRDLIYQYTSNYMRDQGIEGYFYPVQVFNDYFYTINDYTEKYYKVNYTVGDDDIALYGGEEIFPMFLTKDEKVALELLKSNFEKLKEENEELQTFKNDSLREKHKEEAEKMFENFTELQEEDYKDIKENIHDYTLDDIESKLYEILGRKKATFSKDSKTNKRSKFNINVEASSKGYSEVVSLFEKHGVKPIKK